MDIEWAKDGDDGKIYIVQARPETVFSAAKSTNTIIVYQLQDFHPAVIGTGQSIGQHIVSD